MPVPPAADGPEILSVAEFNRRVRTQLEAAPHLRAVLVQGEVSNWFRSQAGHVYFTLKDESAELRCVAWRSTADGLAPEIGNGAEVLVQGDVTVYEVRGQYQLQVRAIQPAGEGLLWMRFQELKRRLEAEGLFDGARKRRLPRVPARIGIVTSKDGAALQDILNVLRRRAPYVEVVVADARVQGKDAAPSLVRALRRIVGADVDVVIIGRGGGSLEDLWAFNEEVVVRAIAACPLPIVSAVGHETDTTLADHAADLRAPTPSAAAETVAVARDELLQTLDQWERRMAQRLAHHVDVGRHRLDGIAMRALFRFPESLFMPARETLADADRRMPRALEAVIRRADDALRRSAGVLDALSPLKVLARGYAVATKDGKAVSRVAAVHAGDELDVRVQDGRITTKVQATKEL